VPKNEECSLLLQNKPRAKVPVFQETTTQRTIIQSAPGMRHPLANDMATHTVNDRQQHTATNGKALQMPEQKTRSPSTKTTETFIISMT